MRLIGWRGGLIIGLRGRLGGRWWIDLIRRGENRSVLLHEEAEHEEHATYDEHQDSYPTYRTEHVVGDDSFSKPIVVVILDTDKCKKYPNHNEDDPNYKHALASHSGTSEEILGGPTTLVF